MFSFQDMLPFNYNQKKMTDWQIAIISQSNKENWDVLEEFFLPSFELNQWHRKHFHIFDLIQ